MVQCKQAVLRSHSFLGMAGFIELLVEHEEGLQCSRASSPKWARTTSQCPSSSPFQPQAILLSPPPPAAITTIALPSPIHLASSVNFKFSILLWRDEEMVPGSSVFPPREVGGRRGGVGWGESASRPLESEWAPRHLSPVEYGQCDMVPVPGLAFKRTGGFHRDLGEPPAAPA